MNIRATCTGRNSERDGWPSVSVVMPIRNEAAHLEHAVAAVLSQEYPVDFDVCLAVGPSDDGTEALADRLAESEPRLTVVANPMGTTPAGLNAAITATGGEIVVRVDGHSTLSPGYIRRAVETMMRTGAVNVGGRQVPDPHTQFEEAVAAAATSWLGTGGATYRVGGTEGPVDTVYLGVFDRAAGDEVGWFDETLIRNQDYELNIRLRKVGGRVWFDPELAVGYRPRGSWTALAKQYYEYGLWKARVARLHPQSVRVRQALAACAAPGYFTIGIAGIRTRRARRVTLACSLVMLGSSRLQRSVATSIVMQVSWSLGFLTGSLGLAVCPGGSEAPR